MVKVLARRRILLGAAAMLPIGGLIWREASASTKAVLYKEPQCRCCDAYAAYLHQHGFDVTVISSSDLTALNRQLGVPSVALDSCHTARISGYLVLGHIPVSVVRRLLAERPLITGISLPGMPSGTPGMTGSRKGPLTVFAFGGRLTVFAHI